MENSSSASNMKLHMKALITSPRFIRKRFASLPYITVQPDASGMDRLSPEVSSLDHVPHQLSHHSSLTGKDTLPLPDSDVVMRSRGLKGGKRGSESSDSGGGGSSQRPASVAVVTGSPKLGRRSSKTGSSTSLNSDCMDTPLVNHEEILQLTKDVRTFSESLSRLKFIFNPEVERTESLRVLAHDKLRDVLNILRNLLDKYSALRSTDIHTAAVLLITQIKNLKDETEEERVKLFDAIDQLALAFSSSVTEFLMGDVEQANMGFPSSKSYESISSMTTSSEGGNAYSRQTSQDGREPGSLSASEVDESLMQSDCGLEMALERAKVWSKYAKDVISYVEKRIHLETDFARSLAKLAVATRTTLKEETYLPFQSTYLTALEHDVNYAQNCDATHLHIQGQKFVQQLEARRVEHDKRRKQIRQTWTIMKKEMQDRKSNLEKCRQQYMNRCQEYEKISESAAKMETEVLNTSGGSNAGKLEKKKKAEEEALMKAKESETTYKACIVEANAKRLEMGTAKRDLLVKVRELIYQCDQTMKAATVSYFQLQHSLSAPAPVQFQTLCEQSRCYEPGVQYAEFVKHKSRVKGRAAKHEEAFVFEPFMSSEKPRKPSSHSLDSTEDERVGAPNKPSHGSRSGTSPERTDKSKPVHAWMGTAPATTQASDSDSMSGSSTKSVDASPSASPMNGHRNLIREASTGTMSSGDELAETDDSRPVPAGTKLIEPVPSSFRNLSFTKAAQTHLIRKLRTPSKCRECDSYVYFNGAECERCGLACHKKCLESLAIQCGGKRLLGRMNVFGVQLRDHLRLTAREAPFLVTKCCSEIDRRALHIKGIYRVAGLKVKVEKLCQTFENGLDLVDLSETPPHLITSVLKLYLRQLPEPLLTFKHYSEFINVAKEFPRSVLESTEEEERLISKLKGIVTSLPEENFKTLGVLMHHLKRVSENEDYNQMSASNLGIVFGPTLLKPNDNTASLSALVDMPFQTRAIEMLVTYSQVFGSSETPVEQFQPEPRELSPVLPELNQGPVSYSPNKSTNNSTHMTSSGVGASQGHRQGPSFALPGSSEDSEDILPCLAPDVGSGEEGDGDSSGNEGEAEEASASEDQPDSDRDTSPSVVRHSDVPQHPPDSSPQPIKQTLLSVANEYRKSQSPDTSGQTLTGPDSPLAQEGYVPSAFSRHSPHRQVLMTEGAEVIKAAGGSVKTTGSVSSNQPAASSVPTDTGEQSKPRESRSAKSRQPQFV
ncbi:rho GTPase-activating protein 45-like isoform X2 [Acanthaster planci]|uniref:Rho GTPase-activating protein 45-like isoform X2 n=1 Tax=Acanthaster planci TaxID=133434 RepID=A0A8B7ZWI8_ACAPL|nr:rho GTPase-activating protein 45-like isoform X2 [Acanthaster planci]XP_022109918.1 rho GTPase-activating protein 45-like isoform X2 [Acanthaster planci]